MTPDQINAEVDRLQKLVNQQREASQQAYANRMRSALRRRREMLEQGRLRMNCTCRGCCEALVTEDPAKLCPNGWATLLQVVGP